MDGHGYRGKRQLGRVLAGQGRQGNRSGTLVAGPKHGGGQGSEENSGFRHVEKRLPPGGKSPRIGWPRPLIGKPEKITLYIISHSPVFPAYGIFRRLQSGFTGLGRGGRQEEWTCPKTGPRGGGVRTGTDPERIRPAEPDIRPRKFLQASGSSDGCKRTGRISRRRRPARRRLRGTTQLRVS